MINIIIIIVFYIQIETNLCIILYLSFIFVIKFRVTIVKDKATRHSKGVAFVLFLNRDEANSCVKATNGIQVVILKGKHIYLIL